MQLIDRGTHQKLYLQLYEILRKKIETNEWAVGTQIPTEENLCEMFGVSRATVRTALLELARQGYLKRQQGKGSFIDKHIISKGLSMLTNFREILFEDGLNLTTKVLAHTVMMPIDDLDSKLDMPKDKHIIYIKRMRLIDDEPALLQETYVPYNICPLLLEDDIEHANLFELFDNKYGIKITKVKNHIKIAHLNHEEARLLTPQEGSPAILLHQFFFSADTLIMYTRSIKRTDRFSFFLELERKTL